MNEHFGMTYHKDKMEKFRREADDARLIASSRTKASAEGESGVSGVRGVRRLLTAVTSLIAR